MRQLWTGDVLLREKHPPRERLFSVTATDLDGDALSYFWSSDCFSSSFPAPRRTCRTWARTNYVWTTPDAGVGGTACKVTASATHELLTDSFSAGVLVR